MSADAPAVAAVGSEPALEDADASFAIADDGALGEPVAPIGAQVTSARAKSRKKMPTLALIAVIVLAVSGIAAAATYYYLEVWVPQHQEQAESQGQTGAEGAQAAGDASSQLADAPATDATPQAADESDAEGQPGAVPDDGASPSGTTSAATSRTTTDSAGLDVYEEPSDERIKADVQARLAVDYPTSPTSRYAEAQDYVVDSIAILSKGWEDGKYVAHLEVRQRTDDIEATRQMTFSYSYVSAGQWQPSSSKPLAQQEVVYAPLRGVSDERAWEEADDVFRLAGVSRLHNSSLQSIKSSGDEWLAEDEMAIVGNDFDAVAGTTTITIACERVESYFALRGDITATYVFDSEDGLWSLDSSEADETLKEYDFSGIVGTWRGTFTGQYYSEFGVRHEESSPCDAAADSPLVVVIDSLDPETLQVTGTFSVIMHAHDFTADAGDVYVDAQPFSAKLARSSTGSTSDYRLTLTVDVSCESCGVAAMELSFGTTEDAGSVSGLTLMSTWHLKALEDQLFAGTLDTYTMTKDQDDASGEGAPASSSMSDGAASSDEADGSSVYDDVLAEYRTAQANGWASSETQWKSLGMIEGVVASESEWFSRGGLTLDGITNDSMCYAYYDFDPSDGTTELVIGLVPESGDYTPVAVFSEKDGAVVELATSSIARMWIDLKEGGRIWYRASGGVNTIGTELRAISNGEISLVEAYDKDWLLDEQTNEQIGVRYWHTDADGTETDITEEEYQAGTSSLTSLPQLALDWTPLADYVPGGQASVASSSGA